MTDAQNAALFMNGKNAVQLLKKSARHFLVIVPSQNTTYLHIFRRDLFNYLTEKRLDYDL